MAHTAVTTSFEGGLLRDVHPRFQAKGRPRHALNMTRRAEDHQVGGRTNLRSDKLFSKIPGTVVGFHRIEERNQTLFFHVSDGSTISLMDHSTGKVTKVVSDTEFGCDWGFSSCQWIGEGHVGSKPLAPCNDLVVYWASGLYYYKANIDELLDPQRRKSIALLEDKCEYFRLMKCSGVPKLKVRVNRDGGYNLPPGQYYAVARYMDESGNTSNWGVIEGPVFLSSRYNKPTDVSRESLRIEAKKLSRNFSRVQIAVIPPVGSSAQDVGYVIYDGSYNTNGVTAEYYSTGQHLEAVPMVELLTKHPKFIRGKNLIVHDNRLYLYRTLQEINPNLQREINKARVKFLSYAVQETRAHRYRSLPFDEVIAPAVQYKYCDGTYSPSFHLHGPEGGSNPSNCSDCALPPGQTGNNARLEKVFVTELPKAEDATTIEEDCIRYGQTVTPNEGYVPKYDGCPPADTPLTPRESEGGDDCVEMRSGREAINSEVETYENRPEDFQPCLDCNSEKIVADANRSEGVAVTYLEEMTDLFKTDKEVYDDCEVGKHSDIPSASGSLFEEAVETAEDDEEIKRGTSVQKKGGENLTFQTETVLPKHTTAPVDGTDTYDDCDDDDEDPILLAMYTPGGYESTLTYPRTLDCDGEPIYGDLAGQRIRYHKTPDRTLVPTHYSRQYGVENRFDPSNVPFSKDTYVVMLGMLVENVYIPSYEKGEIPKPLDPNEPYRIVMAKRERHNKSVVYNGYFVPTYKGKVGNREYAVPRNAAASYAKLDRNIDDNGSHLGEAWDEPIYMFYSPDAPTFGDFATGDYVSIYGELSARGWTYGQYSKGKEPNEETINRKDRRGVRSALAFTGARWLDTPFHACIKGIEFAEHHTNLQAPQGIDYPLLNRYRESGIYLQTETPLPITHNDFSFLPGGLYHEFPISGKVLYGAIKRVNRQQYGAVESLQYTDIGLSAGPGQTSVRGLVGDSFVQKWSHKRTAYVSDKVGNALNVDFPVTATDEFLGPNEAQGGRDRSICDPPNRRGYRMREYLGFWFSNILPESGDKKDPKNMANAHPTLSPPEIRAKVNGNWALDSDLFFQRTLTHLNHLIVDTDTNLHYRSTGPAPTREVYYENLQGLGLDSSIDKWDPEDCWLDDFHNEQLQASKRQQKTKAMIRFFITVVVPAILGGGFAAGTELEASMKAIMTPAMLTMYLVLVHNILSGKKLDRLLGIPECKTDEEGAQNENNIRGLKDNWHDYSIGFSAVNDKNFFLAMPAIYHTCKCEKLSNVVYGSAYQINTSPYDAFSNFQALAFTGLDGTAGMVQRMFKWGQGLYAQMTDGVYALQSVGPRVPQGQTEQVAGFSPLIAPTNKIMEGPIEGYGGTEDPNCAATFKHGHIYFDSEGREIAIFAGSFTPLTGPASGLYHFWKDNIPLPAGECRDEMTPDSTHYAFGYWPEQEMLYVTKHAGDNSFTFGYDLIEKTFVSEYSFVPDFYFWDRNDMFLVKDGEIFKHAAGEGFGSYLGEKHGCSIDFIVRSEDARPFRFSHMSLDTEVNTVDANGRARLWDREETFNTIEVWNQFQYTGKLPLVIEDQADGVAATSRDREVRISRRELHLWKLNHIRSWELDRDMPVAALPPGATREQLNSANFNTEKPESEAKTMKGKWLAVRLEYDNAHQITINGATAHIELPEER